MSEEVKVDDYIFERTLTHLKLVSEQRLEDCKKRQSELATEGKDVALWDVVVDMQYLTQETVSEVLDSYIDHSYAKVSHADNRKIESARINVNDITLHSQGSHKADVLFLKTCIGNNFVTTEKANEILSNITKEGPMRSWEYAIVKSIIKEKIAHKVLKKLSNKFPLKFESCHLPEFE